MRTPVKWSVGGVLGRVIIGCVAVALIAAVGGCARATENARVGEPGPPPDEMMMMQAQPAAEPSDEETCASNLRAIEGEEAAESASAEGMGPGRAVAGMAGLPGGPRGSATREKALKKDGYYTSTYMGGSGERDRVEKLIDDGVIVDGKAIKLAAFTREYSQAFKIPTDQSLAVHVDLEKGKVLQKGEDVHLQVGLQAIKREAPRRPPINLCLVVDRSGSMEDEGKLEYAKRAALDVIDGLKSGDTLAIVAYDDQVEVLFSAQKLANKSRAKAPVQGLLSGGGTNIYGGLQSGYAEVKRNFNKDGINQVILLSDGMVTAGVQDIGAFRKLAGQMATADIQTTAVGMGIDFDETVMMQVAQEGRGNYHFIKTAADTQKVFQKELGQLTRVVAKAVKLRIELPKGVELLRVLGSSALSEEEQAQTRRVERQIDRKVYDDLGITEDRKVEDEPGIKMLIPHFYAGDSHVVMLKIRVPRGKKSREVARVEVKYKDLVFRKNREVNKAAKALYTADRAASVASVNQPVKKNVLGFRTGETLLRAGQYINQGRTGDAAKAIDEQMVVLGVAAREWKDKDLDRDGDLLDRYKQVIAASGGRSIAGTDLGNYLAKSLTYSGYELTR